MNPRNPLAAILLIMASNAAAQRGGSLLAASFNTPTPAFSGPMDDFVFRCGSDCTHVELNKRQQVLTARACPIPASSACQNFLMLYGDAGSGAVQLMGNQSNPATANDEFFKKCGTSPYRLCTEEESKQLKAFLKAQTREDERQHQMIDPGHTGELDGAAAEAARPMPAPYAAADFQKGMQEAIAEQESLGFDPKILPVLDLKDGRYGLVLQDGRVQICGAGMNCGPVRPASDFPNFQQMVTEAKQRASSINKDDSNAGFSAKGTGAQKNPVPPVSQTPPANTAGTGGGALGNSFGAMQNQIASNNFGTSSASPSPGGAGSASSSIPSTTAGSDKVIPVSPDEVAQAIKGGYTFDAVNEADKRFKEQAKGWEKANAASDRADLDVTDEDINRPHAAANSGR